MYYDYIFNTSLSLLLLPLLLYIPPPPPPSPLPQEEVSRELVQLDDLLQWAGRNVQGKGEEEGEGEAKGEGEREGKEEAIAEAILIREEANKVVQVSRRRKGRRERRRRRSDVTKQYISIYMYYVCSLMCICVRFNI